MNSEICYLVISIQEQPSRFPLVMIRAICPTPGEALGRARSLQASEHSDAIRQIEIHMAVSRISISMNDYLLQGKEAIVLYRAERMGSRGSARHNLWSECLDGCFGHFNLLPLVGEGTLEVPHGKFCIVVYVGTEAKLADEVSDLRLAFELVDKLRLFHPKVHIYDCLGQIIEKKSPVLAGLN